MRETILLIALCALLACLGFRGARSGCFMERPYEEGVLRVACWTPGSLTVPAEEYWYEHPRLVPFLVRALSSAVGERIGMMRLVWCTLFLISFALACRSARPASAAAGSSPCALRFLLVFTVFMSPLVLASAMRLGPGAVTGLATGVCILSGIGLISARKILPAILLGVSSAVLLDSHVYGCIASLGLMLPLVAGALIGRDFKLLGLICVAAIPSMIVLAVDGEIVAQVWRTARGHYWAEPVMGEGPLTVPLSHVWYPLTEFAFDGPSIPAVGQLCVSLLLLSVLVRGVDFVSRWLAASALTCIALFWLAERLAGQAVIVHHWLGWHAILSACAIARGLRPWAIAAVSFAGFGFVLVPSLLAIGLPAGRGEEAIERASAFIGRELGPSDKLVFGGSRAYMTILPYLDRDLRGRAILYLRLSHPPDSFPGRNLVPSELRVTSESWADFEWEKATVVQFEAAQRVVIPSEGASVEGRREFVSNSVAVEMISVEVRRRVRDPH